MRFVAISDTHNLHRHYGREPFGDPPDGDVLIHCGDVTTHGSEQEVELFLAWFSRQPHRHKIWIAGNHDRCLEGVDVQRRWSVSGITYLDQSSIEIDGIVLWGSPYTPNHCDFAFQLNGTAREHWKQIPPKVDILITHGPPYGILDKGHDEDHAGCPDLWKEVSRRVRPRYHVFGHLHESYGQYEQNGTVFVNAAVHTWLWTQDRRRDPVVLDVEDGH